MGGLIGQPLRRVDASEKITGRLEYVSDTCGCRLSNHAAMGGFVAEFERCQGFLSRF